MRPFLDEQGRLLPPASRDEAEERVRQLRHECDKIEKQLDDPMRVARASSSKFDSGFDYLDWLKRATSKLGEFRSEEAQNLAWLAGYKAATDKGEVLLQEAHALLCDLELAVELTPEQQKLMEDLDEHCLPTVARRRG